MAFFILTMITIKDNSLILRTPYNPSFVSDLKAQIPATSRKWDATSKVWIVSTQYLKQVEALLWQYYHYKANIVIPSTQSEFSVRQFKLEYLGIPKDRGDGTSTAFGWYNEGWNVIFGLEVLLRWFDPSAKPGQSNSLYGLLGVKKTATDQEIKQAYRRTAKQWHPDICKEPDAHEQFIKIQHAYEILSNEQLRKRYNAGLELMAKTGIVEKSTWRPPVRCGLVLAKVKVDIGRLVVEDILKWDDITDSLGRVMVSSWDMSREKFTVEWISNELFS